MTRIIEDAKAIIDNSDFNSLPFEERKKIAKYTAEQQIQSIVQLIEKDSQLTTKAWRDKQTEWLGNVVAFYKSEYQDGRTDFTNGTDRSAIWEWNKRKRKNKYTWGASEMKYYSETDVKEIIDYAIAYGTDITNYSRPSLDDYPSIEIKEPHGRLIDADELEKVTENMPVCDSYEYTIAHERMKSLLKIAPTVLEASE